MEVSDHSKQALYNLLDFFKVNRLSQDAIIEEVLARAKLMYDMQPVSLIFLPKTRITPEKFLIGA